MTVDTSREAVEALIETVRNKYGAFDHFHRELADAAAALLDERDRLAAKLDALKARAVTDAMVEAAYQAMPRADHVYGVSYAGVRAALKAAILADTDEGNGK